MATEPQIVIRYPLFTPQEAQRAQGESGKGERDFSWIAAARHMAGERMRARAKALAELAAEISIHHHPPVRVSQVMLDAQPGEERLTHRWMVRFQGDFLPGGYCEVPVALDLEAEAARHVLRAYDELRRVIFDGIKFPR